MTTINLFFGHKGIQWCFLNEDNMKSDRTGDYMFSLEFSAKESRRTPETTIQATLPVGEARELEWAGFMICE
jgi:hypothetical protein